MIEPAYAARLGVTLNFPQDNTKFEGDLVARLAKLGIRHVRTEICLRSWRPDDNAGVWHRTAATLKRQGDLLCALLPSANLVHDVKAFLDCHGSVVDTVELCVPSADPVIAATIGLAADAVHKAGKRLVVSLPGNADPTWLNTLAGAVGPGDTLALRPHIDGLANWIETMRAAALEIDPNWVFWITDVGGEAHGVNEAAQAHALLATLDLPVGRIYWRAWDCGDSGSGVEDAVCIPGLAARLLQNGVGHLARALANPAPAILHARPILVTGGAGFIGTNLADRLAEQGNDVLIYDALSRPGVERNLQWLKQRHPRKIAVVIADIRDEPALTDSARSAAAVFHLAAQVAVTTSLVRPIDDFDINVRGTLTILETIRRFNPEAPCLYASTNKVYGNLGDIPLARRGEQYLPEDAVLRANGMDESRPLCFHTPYGCSKGAADQYVLDYARSFGLRTAVLRMSCIYGERQFGTEDQGWLAHFLLRAIAGEAITIYGDGRQVRDVLHVGDAINAYVNAWQGIDGIAGRAFNLGGGPANAISLLQLIDHIECILGRRVDLSFEDWRAGDQRYFVADATVLREVLGLPVPLGWREGVARLAHHFGASDPALQIRESA